MNTFSAYVFRQALGPLLAMLGALAAIAILTQGLNQLDIIISNRGAGFSFAWVTLLSVPQLVALILPLAVFFAVIYAVHRMHAESEIVVVYGSGMSRGRIARPILLLALLAASAHWTINTVIQPAAARERREVIHELRTDIAASLVQEGAFTFPADKLTLYARERGAGGEMRDMLIDDARGVRPITYTARRGAIAMFDGAPAIEMRNGQIQRQNDDGSVEVLDFDRYVLQLGDFFDPGSEYVILKPGDRYLYELFFPDATNWVAQRNAVELLAEGHARLSAPLLNFAMALIALVGVLSGEFSRRGYVRRMMIAGVAAVVLRVLAVAMQAAAAEDPALNLLQYALPIGTALVAAIMLGGKKGRFKRREMGPSLAARA